MSCGVGLRCGSDPALLWLWCRLAAIALIWLLAWEPPHAMGAALKKKIKKKRNPFSSLFFFLFLAVPPTCKRSRQSQATAVTPPNPQPLGRQGTPFTILFRSEVWGCEVARLKKFLKSFYMSPVFSPFLLFPQVSPLSCMIYYGEIFQEP